MKNNKIQISNLYFSFFTFIFDLTGFGKDNIQ